MSENRAYKMIDLFAGCGGLSLGMEQAGFTPWFVNEIVETFCNTYKRNHSLSDDHYYVGDTEAFSRKVPDRALSMEMNELSYDDFLIGKTEDDIPLLTDYNSSLVDRPISAQKVKLALGKDAEKVIGFLKAVNAVLEGTPFKLGYRAASSAANAHQNHNSNYNK